MEGFPTDLEEIILATEILITDHAEIKVMDTNIPNCKKAHIVGDLVEVHGEADHMLDEPMVEVNLPIRMIIVYQV